MYLCDVGNTNATMNQNGRIWSIPISKFKNFKTDEKIFYINVNTSIDKNLKSKKNFINLEEFFDFDSAYIGMGVDRVAACYSTKDGMIVDAGSAIKVDIMSNNAHLGGFILPGISASLDAFEAISPRLKIHLKTNMDLDILPQDTASAVSYGILKPIMLAIKDNCKGKKIFFTGGDGAYLSRFFSQSIYKQGLIFDGMKKAIKENNLENIYM